MFSLFSFRNLRELPNPNDRSMLEKLWRNYGDETKLWWDVI